MEDALTLALVHEVFHGPDARERLLRRLGEARAAGAELALLPELPLNPWCPASDEVDPTDAETSGGPRHELLAEAARTAGLAVLGGAIVSEPSGGRRRNTALFFDAAGELVGTYRKAHLPDEPGFRETAHYGPGTQPPRVLEVAGWKVGIQICSDVNRPQGSHLLAALGAEVILAPRATEPRTYSRWQLVLRANALVGACWVASANRPGPDRPMPEGVTLGGPSVVVDPQGELFAESEEPLRVVRLERGAVRRARSGYPGYLPWRAELYARGWEELGREA